MAAAQRSCCHRVFSFFTLHSSLFILHSSFFTLHFPTYTSLRISPAMVSPKMAVMCIMEPFI